ncbi:MAG: DUF4412 domain-containing protein [Flavobacteriales bacterium]|nr:DUF4412 domain-containing protein [Flavobacteriales bacterium]
MMKNTITILLIFVTNLFWSQTYQITYQKYYHDQLTEPENPIVLFTSASETILTTKLTLEKKAAFPFEQTIINRKQNHVTQLAFLKDKRIIQTLDSTSIANQKFELINEFKTILGYSCQKAKTIINSNTIEVWFTKNPTVKGAPTLLGQDLGLVLEMNRNGNFIIKAEKMEKIKKIPFDVALPSIPQFNAIDYKDLLWKSRFLTFSIFENETIRFADDAVSNDSILRFANGTVILKKIKFPLFDLNSNIFIQLKTHSNGDAYDRTGSVFLVPNDGKKSFLKGFIEGVSTLPIFENGNGKKYQGIRLEKDFLPITELMRFFTPFGIQQYNHIVLKDKNWLNEVVYRQDITDLLSAFNNQEVWIGTFIGNYDKGGHKVALEITAHSGENSAKIASNQFALPLFNTTNVLEMAGQEYGTLFSDPKGLTVYFTLDKPLQNAKLRYITTGHGGWENGDEFVPKKNTISIDGKEWFSFVPWRQDCGSYRLYNPASGNFANGLSSSDYSRSNWCPGTVTNPVYIDLGNLEAGNHTITIQIPQGLPEGTSFSAWNVSGILLGESKIE